MPYITNPIYEKYLQEQYPQNFWQNLVAASVRLPQMFEESLANLQLTSGESKQVEFIGVVAELTVTGVVESVKFPSVK